MRTCEGRVQAIGDLRFEIGNLTSHMRHLRSALYDRRSPSAPRSRLSLLGNVYQRLE